MAYFNFENQASRYRSKTLDKADRMFERVQDIILNCGVDDTLLDMIQHNTELYLTGMIESVTRLTIEDYYGDGNIPHDISLLYNELMLNPDINKMGFVYIDEYAEGLKALYLDWRQCRYAKNGVDYRISDADALNHSEILDDTCKFSRIFMERYNDYLISNQKEAIERARQYSSKDKKRSGFFDRDI